jgi:hypothetical protein
MCIAGAWPDSLLSVAIYAITPTHYELSLTHSILSLDNNAPLLTNNALLPINYAKSVADFNLLVRNFGI